MSCWGGGGLCMGQTCKSAGREHGFPISLVASGFALAQGCDQERGGVLQFLQTVPYTDKNLSPVVSLLLWAPLLSLFAKLFSFASQAKIWPLGCHLNPVIKEFVIFP